MFTNNKIQKFKFIHIEITTKPILSHEKYFSYMQLHETREVTERKQDINIKLQLYFENTSLG